MGGCVYAFSLAADLCTLALTIERFFVICRPLGAQSNRKTELTLAYIFGTIGLSIIRLVEYTFMNKTILDPSSSGTGYISIANDNARQRRWHTILVFISDVILPFILLMCMLYLAVRICLVIIKRRYSHVHGHASSQQQLHMHEESSAMVRLPFILVALFMCNQLGYCLYAAATVTLRQSTISFNSTI